MGEKGTVRPAGGQPVTLFSSEELTGEVGSDDELEKDEMRCPSGKGLEKLWPLDDEVDDLWSTLHIEQDLSSTERQQVLDSLRKYPRAFPLKGEKLGCCTLGKHGIDTGDARPVKQPMRRYSRWQIEEANRQLPELLALGVI